MHGLLSILIHALGGINTHPPGQPNCMAFRSDPPGTVQVERVASTLEGYSVHRPLVLSTCKGLHVVLFMGSIMCGKH